MKQFLPLLFFPFCLVLLSCGKEETQNISQVPATSKTITTVIVHIQQDTSELQFTWSDIDGQGGEPAIVEGIELQKGKMYSVSLELIDQSNPEIPKDITFEIERAGNEYLICLTPENSAVNIDYKDFDKNGFPVGVRSKWSSASSIATEINIHIQYQPNGIKNTVNCDAGTTDLDITFPLVFLN